MSIKSSIITNTSAGFKLCMIRLYKRIIQSLKPAEVFVIIEDLIDMGHMLQGGLGLYDTFVHYDIRKTKARWNG